MKISLNWAQYYSNVNLTPHGRDKLIEKIGAQLGAIDEITDLGKLYDKLLIVKVISCRPHPNADKLKVCVINNGKTTKQVVCGAPNVKEGMLAVWIPPGVTVPVTANKDPFVIEAREIRGIISHGMLASAHELALSDDHSGILEIDDPKAKPGMEFKKLYNLEDLIIDVENKMFTHRPDCFGILGVARELAGIQNLSFVSPDWWNKKPIFKTASGLPVEIKVEDKKQVPRFMAVAIKDVSVKPSPLWLQTYLSRVGIRPINNVVDLTNYFMYLTGQPVHVYDYDKIKDLSGPKPTLVARQSKPGEKLKLLNGKTITFDEGAILIATDKIVVGVGGVMGGADAEVDESTKNLIIECANFDMYSIRRTSMKYGLFTDAVTRFNKGQSPLQNDRVLAKLMADIYELAGGSQASRLFDVHATLPNPKGVRVSPDFINQRLGSNLSSKQISKLLQNVEFNVLNVVGKQLAVVPPFWRTDIAIAEDIVEEVGRLHGYSQLPLTLPTRSIKPASLNPLLFLKHELRNTLRRAGANEILSYTFLHGDLLKKVGQDPKLAYQLSNAISPDLQYYRLSLMPSLLDKVHQNVKAGISEFGLFEVGVVHMKNQMDKAEPKVPKEDNCLALVFANDKPDKEAGTPYYQAKRYLAELAPELADNLQPLAGFDFGKDEWGRQIAQPYDQNRSGIVVKSGKLIAIVGEFKPQVKTALKLPNFTGGFEVNLEAFDQIGQTKYLPLPRYPKISQDISLKVSADLAYNQLYSLVSSVVGEVIEKARTSVEPLDIYQRPGDKSFKQITFRITMASFERTLTDDFVSQILDKVANLAAEKLSAERI